MTFNATLNPVVYEGGIPVFIDMSNVIAGVIRDQYNHLTEHISQKKAIYERYKEGLKDLLVQMNPFDEMNAKPNYWMSSLDEIPEAFNIIKGDMSLIGPRPLLVKYLPYYDNEERLTAYCIQPEKSSPGTGTYDIAKLSDGKKLAKVCYYGTKAAGDEKLKKTEN